jgi:hypothetical protein
MAKYSVGTNNGGGTEQAMTTTFKSLLSAAATSGSLCRGWLYEMNFGPDGAPNSTDCGINWDLSVLTTGGSPASTAITPVSVDPGNTTAALSTCAGDYSTEGTITANSSRWGWAGNQRAGFRWFAYDYSARIGWPATAGTGLILRAKSSNYVNTCNAQFFFEE